MKALNPRFLLRLCLDAALVAGLIGLLGLVPPVARAADDTARFFGQWKTTVSANGQTITIISLHDANGFRNYVVTPTGLTFAGSGAFSAANGIWFAASPSPNNGGAYRFVDNNTAICSNAVGQTVTWRRDKTPLGQGIAPLALAESTSPDAQPRMAASHAPPAAAQSSVHEASTTAQVSHQRGLEAEVPASQVDSGPGGNYALVIGIDDYPAPLPKLKTAVNDAKSFGALLSNKYGFQVTALLNQDATRDKILAAITHFRKALAESDSFLIYYAGHGSFDRDTDRGYWLPVDADSDPLNRSRDISADDLVAEVRSLVARHVIVISDSCFSGDLSRDAGDMSPSDGNQAYIRRMQRAPSRTLMASGSDEPVSDSGSGGHSVFAAQLLQTMQSRSGQVFTADDLFVSIRKPVLARSGQNPQYTPLRNSMRPSASLDTGDFVFNPTAKSK